MPEYEPAVKAAALKALELVHDGARVGLGSGHAASAFIDLLGVRVREGLRVSGVPTSQAAAAEAGQAGIPIIALGDGVRLDLTVDGADEVAPNLDLVKGWGGAFVRERIVARASKRQVIIVGAEKLVRALGEHGRIPLEVIPLARSLATAELAALGLVPTLRTDARGALPLITDNGNVVIDCAPPAPLRNGAAARAMERTLLNVIGVVDTGLFLGTAERVLVGHPDGRVETLRRPEA
ncbi:MAG: ribose-5-phosphate isomerase RpiA [Gemmatimonadales bacterium]